MTAGPLCSNKIVTYPFLLTQPQFSLLSTPAAHLSPSTKYRPPLLSSPPGTATQCGPTWLPTAFPSSRDLRTFSLKAFDRLGEAHPIMEGTLLYSKSTEFISS